MIKKIAIIISSALIIIAALFIGARFYSRYMLGYTKVYVASHNIAHRTLISEEDLRSVLNNNSKLFEYMD